MERYFIKDKSLILFFPGKLHSLDSVDELAGISIDFTEDYFRCIDAAWTKHFKYDVMNDVHVLAIFDLDEERRIKESISMLRGVYDAGDYSLQTEARLYSMLTLLLCTIGETEALMAARQQLSSTNTPQHDLYLRYIDLIENNYHKHHSVQFYSEELCVGVHTLNACCKANASVTPLAVINNRIMQEAKRMLLFSELRSRDISSALGFQEQAHFVNFFKRFTKMSPTKFREANKKCWIQDRKSVV